MNWRARSEGMPSFSEKMEEKDEGNDRTCNNDHEENKRLTLMRSIVEKQDPACGESDDLTLRRFLRARNLEVDKASAMFMEYIKWRREFVPNGHISAAEVANQIEHDKVFMQGTDRRGSPISVIFGARHFPSKGTTDELKRYTVFCLDKVCSRLPAGQDKFTIIGELQGYGYSNSDFRGYVAILSILQDYYPERLGKLFVVHSPYIFSTLYKMVYPFIDKNTKKKIIFVENKKLKETLLEEIDESQLPQIYGGKLQLVPIQDA